MIELGDPPSPEEIFTAFPIGETKITLKSGYGKYLGVDRNGVVVGRSDAVSALEQWEPVFEEKKLALLAANSKFISVSHEDDGLYAHSMTAGPEQILKVYICIFILLRKSIDFFFTTGITWNCYSELLKIFLTCFKVFFWQKRVWFSSFYDN